MSTSRNNIFRFIFAISVLSSALCVARAQVGAGPSNTPISVTPPALPGGSVFLGARDPLAAPGPFFQGLKPPFPTNSWWAGFTVSNQNAVTAGPYPFQSSTTNTGLEFGVSDQRIFENGTWLRQITQYDWSVSFAGLPNVLNNRKALSWDTQTVCLQYFNTGGSTTMNSCLVPGSPYMTFTFKNASVVINSLQGSITSFQWVTTGTKAKVTTSGGTYLIYSIGGAVTLTQQQNKLVSPGGFSGTIRLAKLKDASQEAILDTYSATYATGVVMSYTVANDVSTQTWKWNVVGTGANLLLLSWPHHRKVLQSPKYVNIQYLSVKGYMKGVTGNQWILKHALPTISWFPKNAPQASCLYELNKTLEFEVNALQVRVPADFYRWAGAVARDAQLATIAEHIGRTDLIPKVVDIVKRSVAYWFDPTRRPAITYESGFGGFVVGNGDQTLADYGTVYYNDHHFLYGYLLQSAAIVGKYDPAWLNQNLEFFTHAARDYGNPSPLDPHYAVTRCMDWFGGHSWASGIAENAQLRGQESSTEAINGYYGLLLFATVTNNVELVKYARMLIAIEIAGAQAYWHLYPTTTDPDTPYPEQEFRNLTTVGNVWGARAGAWIYWGAQRIQISAIQILPLTPIGQYTYDSAWMQGVLPYCRNELDDTSITDTFKSVIYPAYAKVNPQEAYTYSLSLIEWGSGNSASNTLYFISTQTSSSDICTGGRPEGIYYIQDVASGLYVTVAGGGNLAATSSIDVLSTRFQMGFVPGGTTIKALSNNKFVTAAPDGQSPLYANRDLASGWELFQWKLQSDGSYQLTAMVNNTRWAVSTKANRDLINLPGSAPSKYRLVQATNPSIPATGTIQNKQSSKYVVATIADIKLRATAAAAASGTTFSFEKLQSPVADPPNYVIRSQLTGQLVSAVPDGTIPLQASRPTAGSWEYFKILPYQGAYFLVHTVSGKVTVLQSDNTLLNNNNSFGDQALWLIA